MEAPLAKRKRTSGDISEGKKCNIVAEYLHRRDFDKVKDAMGWLKGNPIIIQQDGAKPHNGRGNLQALAQAGLRDGWKIIFETQPAQSPDLNKNDLCFFYSLQQQSDVLRANSESLTDMLESVQTAYVNYSTDQLQRVDAIQYEVYRKILEAGGSNQFDMPHSGIRKRQNEGAPVTDRHCRRKLVEDAKLCMNQLASM